jgi:undecaprenyl phosphate N,N'-diacetylbacillosamine 1-phosphate transferase
MYKNVLKHLFDILFASFGLIVISPLFIIIAFTLFVSNKGTPFFFQSRCGKNKKIFKVIKFKTMNDSLDKKGELLSDGERLTGIGKFIRKTSLDELPQLINVIKRDMSLIGPRPFMSEYFELYNDHQNRRHEAMPGITGWAQINGRNNITWQEKFDLDIFYVDNVSFKLDFKILYLTLDRLLKSSDINKKGEVTTSMFNGKN